jgi:amino acid adenylation domain-containing protein
LLEPVYAQEPELAERLVVGGEALEPHHYSFLKGHPVTLVNEYGPTEATVGCSTYIFRVGEERHPVPIGRPIGNVQLYVLNEGLEPLPVGVWGELYIGGSQLASGYHNNASQTSSQFIADPFQSGGRLYRSGDICRWLPDGQLEYGGRRDDQVKIRGYRVMLSEVSYGLQSAPGVLGVEVLSRADQSGEQQLVAFLRIDTTVTTIADIRDHLSAHLPDYMIPSVLAEVEDFPLTSHGKTDREVLLAALPDMVSSDQYVAPSNALEEEMCAIWSELLEVPQVGVTDNFFTLGGHSLLAIRVISAIRKRMQKEIAIKDIFDNPTVSALCALMKDNDNDGLVQALLPQVRPVHIPLSFAQERLWFIDKLQGSVQYHVPFVLRLQGLVDRKNVELTFREIVDRHEILRTVYRETDGKPYQYIKPAGEWQLTCIEGYHFYEEQALQQHIQQLCNMPFNLDTDDMLRAALISLTKDDHILVIVLHHIASDAPSIGILMRELVLCYKMLTEGRQPVLPALPVQYADYAIWQRNYLSEKLDAAQLTYWIEQLSGAVPAELPTDYMRPSLQSVAGDTLSCAVPAQVSDRLLALSAAHGVTPFMTMLAIFKTLLYRYTGQQDLTIGTPVDNRIELTAEPLIGCFLNTLALRTRVKGSDSFLDVLQQVKKTTLEAYARKEIAFEKIVEALDLERDMSRTPLFSIMFVLQNAERDSTLPLEDIGVAYEDHAATISKFDLTVFVMVREQGMDVRIEYCTALFHPERISRLLNCYLELIVSVLESPAVPVSALRVLPVEEELALQAFNDTVKALPPRQTLVELFRRQALHTPEAAAIIAGGQQLNYRELDEASGKLAACLRSKGVDRNTFVPICIERSFQMIIGLLGILKAGGVYVPVDPAYPAERMTYIFNDVQAPLVLTSYKCEALLAGRKGDMETVIVEHVLQHTAIADHPVIPYDAHALTYVLYTSGSTGLPKGVMMYESALINLLLWQQEQAPSRNERILQFASLNFDVSFQEIFTGLCFGGTLVLLQEEERKDMAMVAARISRSEVTQLFVPYVVLKVLAEQAKDTKDYPACLTHVFTAGEQLKLTEDIRLFFLHTGARLFNQYGPTEAHVVSAYEVKQEDYAHRQLPPIGKPVNNTRLYILDENAVQCGIGMIGELHIGGVQVAKGYVQLPELTNRCFIQDKFSSEPGARLYKTGDMACWLPDGNILYMGRRDNQVKVRGHRVEPGEIENVLLHCPVVRQCAVIPADIAGEKRLIAYVVPEEVFDKEVITVYLKDRLPDYMLLTDIIPMKTIPLTPNGKVDTRKLPAPVWKHNGASSPAMPSTPEEIQLAEIWTSLLGVPVVGVKDNFFSLGGHSLLVPRMTAAIFRIWNIRIGLRAVFENPTIHELLENVIRREVNRYTGPGEHNVWPVFMPADHDNDDLSSVYDVTHQQRKEYVRFLLQGQNGFHLRFFMEFTGFRKEMLVKAIRTLIRRHESLRTELLMENGQVKQRIHPAQLPNFEIEYLDLRENEQRYEIARDIYDNLDVNMKTGKLVMAMIVDYLPGTGVLIFGIHHAHSDEQSLRVLKSELRLLYDAYCNNEADPLPPVQVQYRHYAGWLKGFMDSPAGQASWNAYVAMVRNSIAASRRNLPGNYLEYLHGEIRSMGVQQPAYAQMAEGAVVYLRSLPGASYTFCIPAEMTDRLRNLSKDAGASLFMTMITTIALLIQNERGENAIRMYVPFSGRVFEEFEQVTGWVTGEIIACLEVDSSLQPAAQIRKVSQTISSMADYRFYPYEQLLKELDVPLNVLAPVFVDLINRVDESMTETPPAHRPEGSGHFDLRCNIYEYSNGLEINVQYYTAAYTEAAITELFSKYMRLLERITGTEVLAIDDITA